MGKCTRWLVAAMLAAAVVVPASGQPADNRPVRVLIGFAAGGGADVLLRAIAQNLQQALGAPVVVDNKPGAEGVIAAELAAAAPPDGHTLYLGSGQSMVATPVVRGSSLKYDPFKDFTPIANLGRFTMAMVTAPSVPAGNVAEFIDYVRARPGQLNYASGNTTARLAALQFLAQHKLEMVHVPYKGIALVLPDLVAGRVHMTFGTTTTVRELAASGKMRALMVVGDSRSPTMPEVPTSKELGAQISITPWMGLFGPARMQPGVVNRIQQALRASVSTPNVRDRFARQGFEVGISTPAELDAIHRNEFEVFRKAMQVDGVKFD